MPSFASTPTLPVRAVIALGSNVPERISWLQCGLGSLRKAAGIEVLSFSRVYESAPVGEGLSGDFLNAAIACDTIISPGALLETCRRVEALCGRDRGVHMRVLEHVDGVAAQNRTLDCDIIFYGDANMEEPDLQIPHPRWHERAFVILPLLDLIEDLTEGQKRMVEEAAKDISDLKASCRMVDNVLY